MSLLPRSLALALTAALVSAPVLAQDTEGEAWEDKPYTMVDGKVDFGTYNGFRRYHSHCHTCHGSSQLIEP
jgi:mono/diheme cytochrome c family protein